MSQEDMGDAADAARALGPSDPSRQEASRPSASIPIAGSSEVRDGDFSNDADALKLLEADIAAFPESLKVGISLAPRVLYISWPNDEYRPDDGSTPYHCVSVWLAEGNVVAQAIEARRAETSEAQARSRSDESAAGEADAPNNSRKDTDHA